jgi:hypothetical protein
MGINWSRIDCVSEKNSRYSFLRFFLKLVEPVRFNWAQKKSIEETMPQVPKSSLWVAQPGSNDHLKFVFQKKFLSFAITLADFSKCRPRMLVHQLGS